MLVMDNEDELMMNEMVGAMPAMRELQDQANAIMSTGISPNHMVILVAIIFMGKGFMGILDKITDAGIDQWRSARKQKGDER